MKKIFISRGMIVGIFIFLGIVIFLAAVFTIGNQQKTFEKTVTLKAIFDDVNGLQPGNNVWLSGVKIGTVKKINFHGNTQVEIVMNIEKEASRHIQKNAMAKISSDGFIGNKIIVIYGGTVAAENISSGDYLQSEKNTGTDDILSTLQKNNINLLAITENLKTVSERIKDGKGTLGKLINDPSMSENIHLALIHFKTAAVSSEEATAKINSLVNKLGNKGTLINELTTDTSVYSNFKNTIAQLRTTSETISDFADSLKKAGSSLNKNDNAIGLLLHDKEVASDLKEITRNLNTSSQKLDEDLKALQHNFLLRRYFRKKEKQDKAKQDSTKIKP